MSDSCSPHGETIPVVLLGSTGSIGTQAREVIEAHRGRFDVVGLSAGGSTLGELAAQIVALKPSFVAVARDVRSQLEAAVRELGARCPEVFVGAQASVELVRASAELVGTDPGRPRLVVLNGITGGVGLPATLAALQCGARLALANKESLVVGGALVRDAMRFPGQIVPVDSEHSAIAQALASGVHEKGLTSPRLSGRSEVAQIVLTASGGPFRGRSRAQLRGVRAEQALAHPTWKMGKKITIDSATLANKGLEVIEACRLFDVSPEIVKVVVHPESIVHSLVRTKDGMLYAQLSDPDMKHPILSALTWPETAENYLQTFDLFDKTLSFFRPRTEDFPLLAYAYEAAKRGASYTIAYNAADEVAALAFLDGKLSFTDIARVVRSVLDEDWTMLPESFEDVFKADAKARSLAKTLI